MDEIFEPTGLGETIELAWAAGFFDGEGCITLSRGIPVVSIAQVERTPLERFMNAVELGRINGPYAGGYRSGYICRPQYKYALTQIDDVRKLIKKLAFFSSSNKIENGLRLIRATQDIKGRGHKLTQEEIQEIAIQAQNGVSTRDLAVAFSKDRSTISRVLRKVMA